MIKFFQPESNCVSEKVYLLKSLFLIASKQIIRRITTKKIILIFPDISTLFIYQLGKIEKTLKTVKMRYMN